MNISPFGRGLRPLPRLLLLGAVLVAPLAACDTDEILRVDDPEFASPESLRTEAGLPTLVAGAIGDFAVGYGGDANDSFLSAVAVFTDEFYQSDTFISRLALDQRDFVPTIQGNREPDRAYNRLQSARRSLSETADALAELAKQGANDPRYARLKALEGYTFVALGEGFCSGIPISTSALGVPGEAGQPLSTTQVFDAAIERFNTSLAAAPNFANLARVGKARALLNQGKFQEAAAAVADVPTSYVYHVEFSSNSPRQQNPIFNLQDNGRYSVSDREGGNGLPYRSAQDPRVPWTGPFPGFDATVPQYIDLRYPDFGSDVPLATGVEARLIEAEAALRAGDAATWLSKLNALRADVRGLMTAYFDNYASFVPSEDVPNQTLDPLTDPGTEAARVDLMFRERGFWLYTTGHRLGDLRRLVRQYGRSATEEYPSGNYFKGGTFGTDVTFPIPFDETNNTNFTVDMCNTKQA